MRSFTPINNERGGMAALLSVIVLSLIMVSTLTSFYIYLENRAKFQERLRMNYQMGYVMEDMGRQIVLAREMFDNDDACDPATEGTMRWMDCTQVCAQDTSAWAVPAGTPQFAVCVKNDSLNKIINNADYFCAFNTEGTFGVTPPSYCSALANNDNDPTKDESTAVASSVGSGSKIRSWYSRLDRFFDTTIVKNAPVLAGKMYPVLEARIQPPTMFGWMLPEKAYAGETIDRPTSPTSPNTSGGYTPNAATNPSPGGGNCDDDPGGSGCAEQCSGQHRPAFCKNAQATMRLGLVGGSVFNGATGGCATAATPDDRCKPCRGADRNNGSCMRISVCPPWMSAETCMQSDRRIHQMVRIR